MPTRVTTLAVILLAAGVGLAGCTEESGQPTGTTAPGVSGRSATDPAAAGDDTMTQYGSAPGAPATSATRRGDEGDIAFARAMISHHEEAVEMSDLALDSRYGASSRVQGLARQIATAAAGEIAEMSGWLADWGAEDHETADPTEHTEPADAPEPAEKARGGDVEPEPSASGTAYAPPTGPVSPGSMEELAAAQGAEFDRQWLEMMIDHHAGAITMARDVLQTTSHSDVEALATSIVENQTDEIATMREMLRAAPSE